VPSPNLENELRPPNSIGDMDTKMPVILEILGHFVAYFRFFLDF